MDFEEYLLSKKIDSGAFKKADPDQWQSWKYIFEQVHPASFTAQKLFLINSFRHLYPLKELEAITRTAPAKTGRPVVKPRPVSKTAADDGIEKEGVKVKPKLPAKPKIPAQAKPRIPGKPKPVIPGSTSGDTPSKENKSGAKSRPVIKSKQSAEEDAGKKIIEKAHKVEKPNTPVKARPKIPAKPKPAVPGSPSGKGAEENVTSKKARPVIKPKINRPKTD